MPSLPKDDPRSLLPFAARTRIDDAYARSMAIRATAEARIEARCGDRQRDATARIEWSEAKMRAAFEVLAVCVQEFAAIGKHGTELYRIVVDELEAAASSLELSSAEQAAVRAHLHALSFRPQLAQSKPRSRRTGRPRAGEIDGDSVRRARGELSQRAFARICKISTDTLQRAEKGIVTAATIEKLQRAAKRLGSSPISTKKTYR